MGVLGGVDEGVLFAWCDNRQWAELHSAHIYPHLGLPIDAVGDAKTTLFTTNLNDVYI